MTRNLARRFAPPWWAWLLYPLVLCAMLALGRWQLLRAEEKISLIERAEAARIAEPIDVLELGTDRADEAASEYRRVRAGGRWLDERQFLWDNRAHAARAGFEVITPMLMEDGRVVLINRGWLPLAARREQLPDVSLPMGDAAAVSAPVRVSGLFSQPSRGFAGGQAFMKDAPWPRYLQYFDYAAIERAVAHPLVPGVLQPDAVTGPALASEAWRYTTNWQPAASGPQKHYSYAVQWFAMAIALSVIFVVTNLRRPEGEPGAAPPPS